MVNSSSFDSADGTRIGKARSTQAVDTVPQASSTDDATSSKTTDSSKSSEDDLPNDESAVEPTPTKTDMGVSDAPKAETIVDDLPPPKNETTPISEGVVDPSPGTKAKNARKLLCLFCDRTFVSANLRQKHVERVHSLKSARRVSARRQNALSSTPCDHCDKLNSSEHTLNDLFQHLVREHSTKYFGCLSCVKRFSSSLHLTDHYTSQHATDDTEASSVTLSVEPSPNDSAVPHKLTRSKLRSKQDETSSAETKTARQKKSKMGDLRSKKMSVKTSKVAIKRSKRLQQHTKEQGMQKKKRREKRLTSVAKPEGDKSKASCINPYPEFDSFYRVKKITDHSIDNLKISSLTFDDVFDKAFFNRIKCNIEDNLLHHIDGKLFKNEESESRISNFEKITSATQETQNANTDNYGCAISLNAITPAPALSLTSQFGEDFESQIEYGAKPSKKRTQLATKKSDEVHYKYFTRRKYQASILQQKENRDLSKLDMWTQMVVKERQQSIMHKRKSAKEMQEYSTGEEYKSKLRREELNKILDRRGPFEDLKEEASKKAAFDKLNSSSGNDVSQEVFTDVREILNEILTRVYDSVKDEDGPSDATSKDVDHREIPAYLDLRRKTVSIHEEFDKSDKIALICSSQETENFELPTNKARAKNELVELTGEWARSRMYICAACGGKFSNMKYLLDHKSLFHQNVWVQHYEFVGKQGELYRHISIPGLGKVGVVEETIPCKLWKRSEARLCRKCGKKCNSLGELHRHILECGGDWTWLLARKKYKYRPYGAKARRKRSGFEPKLQTKRKTEPSEKKTYKKALDGPRQRPSDADTIQRMLANLPAKRSRRSIISLSDVLFKTRKKKKAAAKKTSKVKCGKKIRIKPAQLDPVKRSSNQRALRSLNKVLSSRILDLNSSLLVKRKMKALRSQRLTRNMAQSKNDSLDVNLPEKDPVSPKEKRPGKKLVEESEFKPARRMLTSRLNLKSFFPVKKNNLRSLKKSSSMDEITAPSDQNNEDSSSSLNLERFKNKKGGLKGFVRNLSLRKRTSSKENEVLATVQDTRSSRSKTKQPPVSPPHVGDATADDKKRKFKNTFRKVINKVKKLKTAAKAPEEVKESPSFLEEARNDGGKVVAPAEVKENSQGPEDIAPIAGSSTDCAENPPIPETIFNLVNNEEKSMQAKGDVNFDVVEKYPDEFKLEALSVKTETTVLPPAASLTTKLNPSVKKKIKKPSRGLNDCIAMLTSKLQQKDDKMSSSVESLFSTSSVTSAEPPVLKVLPLTPVEQQPAALDLSKKSQSTPDLVTAPVINESAPSLEHSTWTSVDNIIQKVVEDAAEMSEEQPKVRTKLDDTIDFVVNSSLNWFEESSTAKLKLFRKAKKKKKRSDDNLITNIIFGKDKLIIAPSSDSREDPLIARLKKTLDSVAPAPAPPAAEVVPETVVIPVESEDELPLSTLAKQTVEAVIEAPPKMAEIFLKPPTNDESLETVNTDSLKENVEEPAKKVVKTLKKKKKKRALLVKRKRLAAKNTNVKPLEGAAQVEGIFGLIEIGEEKKSETLPETVLKPDDPGKKKDLNVQRTRRKSKSSKKIDKIENDLFKNFALVINKKTKRIPPTNIVDDSVSDDLSLFGNSLDTDLSKSITEDKEVLNDSVEEMDMEIEDIPIKTNIIERDSSLILPPPLQCLFQTEQTPVGIFSYKLPPPADDSRLQQEPLLPTTVLNGAVKQAELPSPKDFDVPLQESTPKRLPTGRKSKTKKSRKVIARDPKPGEWIEVSQSISEGSLEATEIKPTESDEVVTPSVEPVEVENRNDETFEPSLVRPAAITEDSGFVERLNEDSIDKQPAGGHFEEEPRLTIEEPLKVVSLEKLENSFPVTEPKDLEEANLSDKELIQILEDEGSFSNNGHRPFRLPESVDDEEKKVLRPRSVQSVDSSKSKRIRRPVNYNEDNYDSIVLAGIERMNEKTDKKKKPDASKEPATVYKPSEFSEIPKLVVDIHHADQIDARLQEYLVKIDYRDSCDLTLTSDMENSVDMNLDADVARDETAGGNQFFTGDEMDGIKQRIRRSRKTINYNEDDLFNLTVTAAIAKKLSVPVVAETSCEDAAATDQEVPSPEPSLQNLKETIVLIGNGDIPCEELSVDDEAAQSESRQGDKGELVEAPKNYLDVTHILDDAPLQAVSDSVQSVKVVTLTNKKHNKPSRKEKNHKHADVAKVFGDFRYQDLNDSSNVESVTALELNTDIEKNNSEASAEKLKTIKNSDISNIFSDISHQDQDMEPSKAPNADKGNSGSSVEALKRVIDADVAHISEDQEGGIESVKVSKPTSEVKRRRRVRSEEKLKNNIDVDVTSILKNSPYQDLIEPSNIEGVKAVKPTSVSKKHKSNKSASKLKNSSVYNLIDILEDVPHRYLDDSCIIESAKTVDPSVDAGTAITDVSAETLQIDAGLGVTSVSGDISFEDRHVPSNTESIIEPHLKVKKRKSDKSTKKSKICKDFPVDSNKLGDIECVKDLEPASQVKKRKSDRSAGKLKNNVDTYLVEDSSYRDFEPSDVETVKLDQITSDSVAISHEGRSDKSAWELRDPHINSIFNDSSYPEPNEIASKALEPPAEMKKLKKSADKLKTNMDFDVIEKNLHQDRVELSDIESLKSVELTPDTTITSNKYKTSKLSKKLTNIVKDYPYQEFNDSSDIESAKAKHSDLKKHKKSAEKLKTNMNLDVIENNQDRHEHNDTHSFKSVKPTSDAAATSKKHRSNRSSKKLTDIIKKYPYQDFNDLSDIGSVKAVESLSDMKKQKKSAEKVKTNTDLDIIEKNSHQDRDEPSDIKIFKSLEPTVDTAVTSNKHRSNRSSKKLIDINKGYPYPDFNDSSDIGSVKTVESLSDMKKHKKSAEKVKTNTDLGIIENSSYQDLNEPSDIEISKSLKPTVDTAATNDKHRSNRSSKKLADIVKNIPYQDNDSSDVESVKAVEKPSDIKKHKRSAGKLKTTEDVDMNDENYSYQGRKEFSDIEFFKPAEPTSDTSATSNKHRSNRSSRKLTCGVKANQYQDFNDSSDAESVRASSDTKKRKKSVEKLKTNVVFDIIENNSGQDRIEPNNTETFTSLELTLDVSPTGNKPRSNKSSKKLNDIVKDNPDQDTYDSIYIESVNALESPSRMKKRNRSAEKLNNVDPDVSDNSSYQDFNEPIDMEFTSDTSSTTNKRPRVRSSRKVKDPHALDIVNQDLNESVKTLESTSAEENLEYPVAISTHSENLTEPRDMESAKITPDAENLNATNQLEFLNEPAVEEPVKTPETTPDVKKRKSDRSAKKLKNNMDLDVANILEAEGRATRRRVREKQPEELIRDEASPPLLEQISSLQNELAIDNFTGVKAAADFGDIDDVSPPSTIEREKLDTDLFGNGPLLSENREAELAKINIKTLLLSSSFTDLQREVVLHNQPVVENAKKQKKKTKNKKLSIATLKDVLSTFTDSNAPLTDIITSSEMDIAPVLDEIDKSLESEDIYDFYEEPAAEDETFRPHHKTLTSEEKRRQSDRSAKLKALENIHEEAALSDTQSFRRTPKKKIEVALTPEELAAESNELRRSRRGSRKVASYNENDLIDPLIDALEKTRTRAHRKEKADLPPPERLSPKLSSEELFDLLKNSSVENTAAVSTKPLTAFEQDAMNQDSSNSASRGLIEGGSHNFQESPSDSVKAQYANKIYEFTDDSPDTSKEVNELFGKSKKKYASSAEDNHSLPDNEPPPANYCDICKKSFIRVENLVKHRTTLTHISKLSELEAREAEERARLQQKESPPAESDSLKTYISITDLLQTTKPAPAPVLPNTTSLNLVDIISDVLNKPITDDYKSFSEQAEEASSRRYKSLGERKSFESNRVSNVETQINLLENIIGTNLTQQKSDSNFDADGESSCSNLSYPDSLVKSTTANETDFIKPTQYEEISEDSSNAAKLYEDQKQRKTLNRDEELFLECCSLLKSGSEMSNSNYSKKAGKVNEQFEKLDGNLQEHKLVQGKEEAHEYSDNSRTPTPLGDTYDDEASNSNTISSNWHLNPESKSGEDVKTTEEPGGITFTDVLSKGFQNLQASPSSSDASNASKKVVTKGARKVYEGLKVSIPMDDLNLEVLNGTKKPSDDEVVKTKQTRKSKPVKKSQVGSNLLFKVNKKRAAPDVFTFDETQDNTEVFVQPPRADDNDSLGFADSIGADAKSVSSVSSVSQKPPPSPDNITKNKYKIMGKIFKNVAKSKADDLEEQLRNIPEIPEMDNRELVENYVRSCQDVKSPFLPPPPPPPCDELPKKTKMTEEEMNMLFDQLIGKDAPEERKPPSKPKTTDSSKKKAKRKRTRANSDSSDDEFNISTKSKKRHEDSGINLELELKECIGVASRKSQRTCTSGKQNVLVEYWSSDEEAFEAMLENNKIAPSTSQTQEPPEMALPPPPPPPILASPAPKPKPTKKRPPPRKKPKPVGDGTKATPQVTATSNRRKRAAADPLYHWSSSSEDESQSLIEIKPVREEDDDDEDRPIQHGWIVGDSPKKLVTMLALTKGKKTDFDSVKEQGKKRASNATS